MSPCIARCIGNFRRSNQVILLLAGLMTSLICLPAPAAAPAEKPRPDARFGNWLYKTPDPAKWKRSEKDGQLVFSIDLPPGDFCTLTLFPGGNAQGEFAKQFDAAIAADQKEKGTIKIDADGGAQATKSAEGFDVLTRSMTCENSTLHTLHFYLAGHSGDRFDIAAFQTSGDETWKLYGQEASNFLFSLKLANSLDAATIAKLLGPGAAPTDVAAKQAAAGKSTYRIGDSLEVNWHGTWYKAVVRKIDGGNYFIHYEAFADSWDEWVGPDLIRSIGSNKPGPAAPVAAQKPAAKLTPAQAQPGQKGLDGLYLQIQSWMFNGSLSFEYRHYWFRPDGNVYFGVPPGGLANPADFGTLQKLDPDHCGTYGINGKKITIQHAGGQPVTTDFSSENGGAVLNFDGPGAVRVGSFKNNQTLEGNYEAGATVKRVGSFIAASATMVFHRDGTYTAGRLGTVQSTGDRVSAGASAESSDKGTYKLSGNTLTITHANGKSDSFTAYPYPDKDESPPAHLNINGEMYKLEAAK